MELFKAKQRAIRRKQGPVGPGQENIGNMTKFYYILAALDKSVEPVELMRPRPIFGGTASWNDKMAVRIVRENQLNKNVTVIKSSQQWASKLGKGFWGAGRDVN